MAVFDDSNLSSGDADVLAKIDATTQGLLLLDSHLAEPDYVDKKAWMTARLAQLITEAVAGDTDGYVAATLSDLAATGGDETYTGAVITGDMLNGTYYYMVVADGGTPNHAAIKAGTNALGSGEGSFSPTLLVDQPIPAVTGLTASTGYELAITFETVNGDASTPAIVGFTTSA